jgi:hypothetical protein
LTDIKSVIDKELLGPGIDKNIFEAVNTMKKTLLEVLSD